METQVQPAMENLHHGCNCLTIASTTSSRPMDWSYEGYTTTMPPPTMLRIGSIRSNG